MSLDEWVTTTKPTWWCFHCGERVYEVGPSLRHGWASGCWFPEWLLKQDFLPTAPMTVTDVNRKTKTITFTRGD